MYRLRKMTVGLSLVLILIVCLVFVSKQSTVHEVETEESLSALSQQHVIEAVRQQIARNKPLVIEDMWQKRTTNHDKVYNEQYRDQQEYDGDVNVEVERERERNLEKEREKDAIGDGAKEREQVMRSQIDTGVVRLPNTNNRTVDKQFATVDSRPQQILSRSGVKFKRPYAFAPDNEPRFNNIQDSQSFHFNQNPPKHLPASMRITNRSSSVHSHPKLPMSHQNNYKAPSKVAAHHISHRNYSKVYRNYVIEKKNKRLAEVKEEQIRKIATQELLKSNCQGTKYCLAGVARDEHWMHDECFLEALKDRNKSKIELNPCRCELLSPTDPISETNIGLVSLAGSGNTWLRGLLEKATGICTASMWCDTVLRAKDFCAEGLHSSLALVIKNHDPTIRWRGQRVPKGGSDYNKPQFDAVVFLHRDPYDAMIAEWNRALGKRVRVASLRNESVGLEFKILSSSSDQHTAYFGEKAFRDNDGWNKIIRQEIVNWEEMIYHLIVRSKDKPVLVIRYEDLQRDAITQVKRILSFLRFVQVPEHEIESRLQSGFQSYHRSHTYSFDHYTQEQKAYVNSVIRRVEQRINQNAVQFIPLDRYIRQ